MAARQEMLGSKVLAMEFELEIEGWLERGDG